MTATRPRRPISQTIADELLADMRSGQYRPGDVLPTEAELAQRFDVSRPTLRESLRRLSALGVVNIVHGHRAAVSLPGAEALACFIDISVASDPDGLREAVEFRAGLETDAVMYAAQRASNADIGVLGELIAEMSRERNDDERWAQLHAQFHVALIRASGNRLVMSMYEALSHTIVLTSRRLREAQPGHDADATFQRHLDVFNAVKSGDAGLAQAAMSHHFTVASAVLARHARMQASGPTR